VLSPHRLKRNTQFWILPSRWLTHLKLFELSVSAGNAGKDVALSYKKILPIMRICEGFY